MIDDLIARARAFRAGPFAQQQQLYRRLVRDGQSPKIAMIACSDSRVDPSIIFNSDPGDIFMVRNVASLVPPCDPDQHFHGTSAALEFGVLGLDVAHVVVLGHGHCGGIEALLRGADRGQPKTDFIGTWLTCASTARDRILRDLPDAPHAEQARALEYETVRQSLANLMTFPWIAARVRAGTLALHGWHFDIAEGALSDVGSRGAPVRLSG
jgi:carbonic anhydrase